MNQEDIDNEKRRLAFATSLSRYAQEIRESFNKRIAMILTLLQMLLGSSIFADSNYHTYAGIGIVIIGVIQSTFKFSNAEAESQISKNDFLKITLIESSLDFSLLQKMFLEAAKKEPHVSYNAKHIAYICAEIEGADPRNEELDGYPMISKIQLNTSQWILARFSGFSFILSNPNVYTPFKKIKKSVSRLINKIFIFFKKKIHSQKKAKEGKGHEEK